MSTQASLSGFGIFGKPSSVGGNERPLYDEAEQFVTAIEEMLPQLKRVESFQAKGQSVLLDNKFSGPATKAISELVALVDYVEDVLANRISVEPEPVEILEVGSKPAESLEVEPAPVETSEDSESHPLRMK